MVLSVFCVLLSKLLFLSEDIWKKSRACPRRSFQDSQQRFFPQLLVSLEHKVLR